MKDGTMKVSVKTAFKQLVEREIEDIKRDVRLELKMRETEKHNPGQEPATGEVTLRNATRSGLKRELARRRAKYEIMEREDTPPSKEDRGDSQSRSRDKGAQDAKKLWMMWTELSGKNKENVCRFYSVGKCNRGDKCKFDHTCAICGDNHSMKNCRKPKK